MGATAGTTSLGQPVRRIDGIAKVTGRARYTADFKLPGLLWGACLRSPHPSARIVAIDAAKAKALPGVHAVLTASDVPETLHGRTIYDIPILARDCVRFAGEKVAAVAAETRDIAEAALALIEVRYEELPAVFDAEEAMHETAPRVQRETPKFRQGILDDVHGEPRLYPPIPNVVCQHLFHKGDVAEGFSRAQRIFEHNFTTPSVHQGYIEPHSVLVAVAANGDATIWASTKAPHVARGQLARALDLPPARIRFEPVTIGGDFGGKGSLMDMVLCYHLARSSGRPVKMVMSYYEELTAANPRHASKITLRTGIDRNGAILAVEARMIFNCGAYAGFTPLASMHGYTHIAGSYRLPNLNFELLRVHTHTVPTGHMRSPGAPQITFAVESHFDMIAYEMGIDPIEFRRRNAIAEGDLSPLNEKRRDLRCRETLEAALRAWDWTQPKPPNVGRGLALHEYPPGNFGDTNVTVTIDRDGKIALVTGAPENGAGMHTIAQQLLAAQLHVSVDDVAIVLGDTDSSGFDVGASGSRLTVTVGQAIDDAAAKLIAALGALAAEHLGCAAPEVRMTADGGFAANGKSVGRAALMAWAATRDKAPLSVTGRNKPNTPNDITAFAAQLVEVEVDRETGQVSIRRVVTAHDVGAVINPLTHQGQIEGGIVQAVGQAMSEHLVKRNGAVVTATLGDYKLPTIMDIPELTTVLVPGEGAEAARAKSIGEMSNVALPAAIANAVFDAVGVRLTELPISAEKILEALQAKANEP